MLESAGLGEDRLAVEINKRLAAKVTKFHQDKIVCDVEDNATRMRATELLADLLHKRKTELDVHTDLVEIVPPPRPEDPAPDED